jgi:hypothetical protein
MEADQALLVEGARHPRWLPFTIEHTDIYSDHRHFCESLAPNALAGFNTKMTESLMRTSPGGNRSGAVLVDRRRVDAWAGFDGTSYVSEQMDQYNAAILGSVVHRKFRHLMELPAWRGLMWLIPFRLICWRCN